jgi:hypothetical protein
VAAGGGARLGGAAQREVRAAAQGALGLAAAPRNAGPRREGRRLAARRQRPLPPGPPGAEGARTGPRRGPGHPPPPCHVRPDRPAADARGDRGVPRGHLARRLREGGGPAARLAGLRRALGAALAGRGPLRGIDRVGAEPPLPARLALPRLGHRRLQHRPALRPVPPRAAGRRPAAGRVPVRAGPATGRDRVPGPGRARRQPALQGAVHHGQRGRADRHGQPGGAGPDSQLRPLPQPQVRPDPDDGLLRPGRHLPQHGAVRRPAEQDGRRRPGLLRHGPAAAPGRAGAPGPRGRPRAGREGRAGEEGPGAGPQGVSGAAGHARGEGPRAGRAAEADGRAPEDGPAPGRVARADRPGSPGPGGAGRPRLHEGQRHRGPRPRRGGAARPRRAARLPLGVRRPGRPEGQPHAERPAGTGAVADQSEEPAHPAGDGQPRLAPPVRPGAGAERGQLRRDWGRPVAPRIAGPPGGPLRPRGLVGQEVGAGPGPQPRVPARLRGPGGERRRRPGQPPRLAAPPAQAGRGGDPRRDAGRLGRARPGPAAGLARQGLEGDRATQQRPPGEEAHRGGAGEPAPQRLPAAAPRPDPAGPGGVRLRRAGDGHRQPRDDHGRPAGPVPAERPVRAAAGPGAGPAAARPGGPGRRGPHRPGLPADARPGGDGPGGRAGAGVSVRA